MSSLFEPRPHVDELVEEARESEKKGKRHLKDQHVDEGPANEAGSSPVEKSADYGETPQKKQDTEREEKVDGGPAKLRATHGREETGGHERRGRGKRSPETTEGRLGPVRLGKARAAREPVDDESRVKHRGREDEARELLLDQDPAELEESRDGREGGFAPAARSVVGEHFGDERGPATREDGSGIPARRNRHSEEGREAANPGESEDDEQDVVPPAAVPRRREERHGGKGDEGDRENCGDDRSLRHEQGAEEERDRDCQGGQNETGREALRFERRAAEARSRMRRQNEAEGRCRRGQRRRERRPEDGEGSLNRRRMAEARGSARA